jgi:DnaJ-class molecular chaperone
LRPMTKQHDWGIEKVRTCATCDGTGRNPRPTSSGPGQTSYAQSAPPLECPTCGGKGEERKRITLVELAAELKAF